MNNEKYNQIIDEVYRLYLQHTVLGVNTGLDKIKGYLDNCLIEFDGSYEHFTNPSFQYGLRPHIQEEFINKCKTDNEFSERWELKIEERELSSQERKDLYDNTNYVKDIFPTDENGWNQLFDGYDIPTKLITITYNNETTKVYE